MPATPFAAPRAALHLVPAGRRIDFDAAPGQYAYVYRRSRQGAWECVAQNAHSPFLDRAPLPPEAQLEYVVLYVDGRGLATAASAILPAHPASRAGVRTS